MTISRKQTKIEAGAQGQHTGSFPKVGKKEGTEEWRGGNVKGRKGGQT